MPARRVLCLAAACLLAALPAAAQPRAHGRDERMLVKSFLDGQQFLYDLVREPAGGRPVS